MTDLLVSEDDLPVAEAVRKPFPGGYGSLVVICPFCRLLHVHGGGGHPGEGDGPRRSHCQRGEYLVREVNLS